MKKIFFLVGVFLCLCSLAFGQVSVEINDSFYKQAQIWELRGLTDTLPQLRPYPVNVIKRILGQQRVVVTLHNFVAIATAYVPSYLIERIEK